MDKNHKDAAVALNRALQFHRVARLLDVVSEGDGLSSVAAPLLFNHLQALELAFKALLLAKNQTLPADNNLPNLFLLLDSSLQSHLHFQLSREGHGDMFEESAALVTELAKLGSGYAKLLSLQEVEGDKGGIELLKALTPLVIKQAQYELTEAG